MKQKLRPVLGAAIVAGTLLFFGYYLSTHPKIVHTITSLNPLLLVLILLLYSGFYFALLLVMASQLFMHRKRVGMRENLLLNAYASLVNFFIPGQGGPGVRALYLKNKTGLKMRSFFFTTLLYYACYAVISGAFLLIGSRPWWQSALGIMAIMFGCVAVIYLAQTRKKSTAQSTQKPRIRAGLPLLFAATLLQLSFQVAIFYLELKNVNPHASLNQAVVYTGAANFALFVSLTPGAIGIRESFLAATQSLHHIPGNTMLTASVIDRASYLVFLGLLFVIVLSMHASEKLQLTKLSRSADVTSGPKQS